MKILFVFLLIFLSACAIDHQLPISGVPRGGGNSSFFEDTSVVIPDENTPLAVPLLYKAENFAPAMYENEGTYIGAWLAPGADKRSFLRQTQQSHAVFVYEMTACDEIPVRWILECMANRATPLIIIHPPVSDYATETEWIIYLAYRLGSFNLPMFVALYPSVPQGMDYTTQEFAAIYRFARSMFSLHAPLTSFVWVAPALNSTIRNPFFPGSDVVDWVGTPLMFSSVESEDLDLFEAFYHRFAPYHPIMILPLGISHFSAENHSYRVAGAAEDIKNIYRLLLGFPRVGMIVYGDAFGTVKTGGDDFSISIESQLINAYRDAISRNGFLHAIEKSPQGTTWHHRDLFNAYVYNEQIFINTETLQSMDIPFRGTGIEINGGNYISAEHLQDIEINYCEDLKIVFIFCACCAC